MKPHSLTHLIKRSALLMPLLRNKEFCAQVFPSSQEKCLPLCGKRQSSRGNQGAIIGAGRDQGQAAPRRLRLVLCLTATEPINK